MASKDFFFRINDKELNRFLRTKGQPVHTAVKQIAQDVLKEAQENAPSRADSISYGRYGTLGKTPVRQLLKVKDVGGQQDVAFLVGGNSPKIGLLEEGAPAHTITPSSAPKLRFRWPKIAPRGFMPDGQLFITPSTNWPRGLVHHPGFRGFHFLREAIETVGKKVRGRS